jgi:dipeptidyl aminopeptidase/acylaminoacyl peptidase
MNRACALFFCLVMAAPAVAEPAQKRAMTVDDLFAFQRVADPQISPDGKSVVYAVTTVDLAGNRSSTNLWLVAVRCSATTWMLVSATFRA